MATLKRGAFSPAQDQFLFHVEFQARQAAEGQAGASRACARRSSDRDRDRDRGRDEDPQLGVCRDKQKQYDGP